MQAHELEQALAGMDEAQATKLPELPHDSTCILDVYRISSGKTFDKKETFMIFDGKVFATDKPDAMPEGTGASVKFFGLDSKQYDGRYAQERQVGMRSFLAAMTKLPVAATSDQILAATGNAQINGNPVNSWIRLGVFLASLPPGALKGKCLVRVVSGPTQTSRNGKKFCDQQYYPATGA